MDELGVEYRKAEPEDYEGVMNITVAFSGTDYLPYMYPKNMKDSMVHSFVCVKDGIIISFLYILICDGGRTVIQGGARTKEEYRNKHYSGNLVKYVTAQVRYIMSKLGQTSYDALYVSLNYPRRMEQISKKGHEILFWRGCLYYTLKEIQIAPLKNKIGKCLKEHLTVKQLFVEETATGFIDAKTSGQVFPKDKISMFWEPYDVTAENIRYFMNRYKPEVYGVKKHNDDSYCGFGCFTTIPVNIGTRFEYEFYGSTFEEWKALLKAGLQNFHMISEIDNIMLVFLFPIHLDNKKLKDWIQEKCGLKIATFPWVLYEYQIIVKDTETTRRALLSKM